MKELGIDIETYSSYSLPDCGVYRYVEAPDFAILLFAYSVDGGKVECVDLASGEQMPYDIMEVLIDDKVIKTAFNAQFERTCIAKYFRLYLDPSQWRCTMARASMMGLPMSLGQCAEVLGLKEGKMKEGQALIRYFSVPGKNGRRMPSDAPEKWATFKAYNIRDVEVEQQILAKVKRLEQPAKESRLYVADQHINDRGVKIDRRMVEMAAKFDNEYKERLLRRAKEITGLENPNSISQLKQFIHEYTGLKVDTINKASLDDLRSRMKLWPVVTELLDIRSELGKTSNKKYEAMLDCVCSDGRIRGLLQYYGTRTGRWAGRLVQVQNLPQNHMGDIDDARELVKAGDLDEFEMNFSNPTKVLSELIRTAFVADEGKTLHVCDFSAIEARVIAWLAGESWVLDTFRQGKDLYCETASKMFGVPVEKHGQNSHLRQKGKIAVLALGYGGGIKALESMGGGRMGLTEAEETEIVQLWRKSNRHIVLLWSIVEDAAVAALRTGRRISINKNIVVYKTDEGQLIITLPSGRSLCYQNADMEIEHRGSEWSFIQFNYPDGDAYPVYEKKALHPDTIYPGDKVNITYDGLNQTTKKWETVRTYGGKLVENIVQAIARDILGEVILRAEKARLPIVFHVHDEIVVEADKSVPLSDVEALFNAPVSWCRDLPLKGVGYTTQYYLKD